VKDTSHCHHPVIPWSFHCFFIFCPAARLHLFLDKHISENLSDLESLKAAENADVKDILTKHFFHRIFNLDHSNENNDNKKAKLGDDVLSDLEVLQDYQNTNPKNTLVHALSACPSWPQANHHTQGANWGQLGLFLGPWLMHFSMDSLNIAAM